MGTNSSKHSQKMRARSTKIQAEINGSITVTHGHLIVSNFGDQAQIGFNTSQNASAKESIKSRFYGVPAENHAFVDRPNILTKMEDALSKDSDGCRILALIGLGGMGKTQLMLRYCYLHRSKYDFIFWLEVDGWSTAIDSFRKLAINLGLDVKNEDSEERIIEQVVSWLQMRTKWLLLLNNADDGEMDKKLFEFIPRIGGEIILTTRINISSRKAMIVHVDRMQEDEAICLLLDISSTDLADQESAKFRYAREIVTELDCMPLATNLARAYVNNMGASFKHYLSMLKTKRNILFQYHDEDSIHQYHHAVSTVWNISLEQVRAQNPTAVQILKACAFFKPENIPVRFFEQQHSALEFHSISLSSLENEERSEQESLQESEDIQKAIVMLAKFSFITRTRKEVENEEDLTSDLLTIHRLVQKVIYDTLDDEQKLHWAHKIATALNSETYFSWDDIYTIQTQSVMNVYVSHIRHFVSLLDKFAQKPFISEDLRNMLDRKVYYLMNYGIYFGIEEYAQLSIQISQAMDVIDGSENSVSGESLYNLAKIYKNQGKYNEAELLYQRALVITEKVLGSEHRNTAKSLNELALLYNDQGKYDEAEPLYQRALAIYEKVLGSEHVDAATLMNNLALLYDNQGKYDEAEPLYQRALVIREKVLGSEHPDTAGSLNNLALLYNNQGKYKEAEPLYQRALVICEKVLGSEHPDTALALNNLAILYKNQGKYDKAEPLYKRSLVIKEKLLGSEHPDTALAVNNLAILYKNQGKYDKAEPLYKRSLAIREKSLGSEHPDTAGSLQCLANLYKTQGKYDKVEPLYKRSLAIYEKSLGSEHPETALALNNLAGLYRSQSKYYEAEPLYKRSLAIREKMLGLEHPSTVTTLNNLAGLYENQGKYDEAESLYRWVLAIRNDKRTFDTRYITNVIMGNHDIQLPHQFIDFLLDSSTAPYIDIIKRVGHSATTNFSDALLNPEPHQALLTTKKKYIGVNAQGMILILPETFGQNHQSGGNISSLRSLLTCSQIVNHCLFPTRVYIATLMRWGGGWGLLAEEGKIVDDFLELEKFNIASFVSTQIVELAKNAIQCKDECAQIIIAIGNVQQALETLRFYIPLEQHELKILRQALKYYQAIKEMCPFLEAASASTYSRMRKKILGFNEDINRVCNAIESSSRTLEQSFHYTSLDNSNECKAALDQVVNLRSVLTVVWDGAALRILTSPRTGHLYAALHQVTIEILKILEPPNELVAIAHTLLPNPKTGLYDRDDQLGVALYVQRELSDEQVASVHRMLEGTIFHGVEQFVASAGKGGEVGRDSDDSDESEDDDDDDDNVDIEDEELHYSENGSQHFHNNANDNSDSVERSEPKDTEGSGGQESHRSGAPSLGVGGNADGNDGSLSSHPGERASRESEGDGQNSGDDPNDENITSLDAILVKELFTATKFQRDVKLCFPKNKGHQSLMIAFSLQISKLRLKQKFELLDIHISCSPALEGKKSKRFFLKQVGISLCPKEIVEIDTEYEPKMSNPLAITEEKSMGKAVGGEISVGLAQTSGISGGGKVTASRSEGSKLTETKDTHWRTDIGSTGVDGFIWKHHFPPAIERDVQYSNARHQCSWQFKEDKPFGQFVIRIEQVMFGSGQRSHEKVINKIEIHFNALPTFSNRTLHLPFWEQRLKGKGMKHASFIPPKAPEGLVLIAWLSEFGRRNWLPS